MKQKLENILCVVVVVQGMCVLIAMFLLTHPKIFNTIRNEINRYSVVGFTNGRTLAEGANVLPVYSHLKKDKI